MTKRRIFISATIVAIGLAAIYPYESLVVPAWKVRVTDVAGTPCQSMPVMETWAHYSLFLSGNFESEDRVTDTDGFVKFPKRSVRAIGIRRIVMPLITGALVIAHGGYGADASVHVSGLKDVAWLSYGGKLPLPDTAKVERCLVVEDFRPKKRQQ